MFGKRLMTTQQGGSAFNGGDFNGLEYQLVTNPTTGRVWLDRNLGANRVSTSSSDSSSYGWLYQWGRLTDGHQIITSATTSTQSTTDVPINGKFITGGNDWRYPSNNNLWQGVDGINNPAPPGFRLPTEAEWNAERLSWSGDNSSSAFGSVLKLTATGYRVNNGSFNQSGTHGRYCSSSVSGTSQRYLFFDNRQTLFESTIRAFGFSVRCIKD